MGVTVNGWGTDEVVSKETVQATPGGAATVGSLPYVGWRLLVSDMAGYPTENPMCFSAVFDLACCHTETLVSDLFLRWLAWSRE